MHVIRHYAPCVYAISNPIEVSQCFRHLTGYDRLREKATTGAGIQLLFDLFAEELFESSFFERRQIPASSSRGGNDVRPLEFKLPKHRLRQRVCKAKRNEIDGIVLFPMRQLAAAANGWHSGIVVEKSRRDAGVTEWPPRLWPDLWSIAPVRTNPRAAAANNTPGAFAR